MIVIDGFRRGGRDMIQMFFLFSGDDIKFELILSLEYIPANQTHGTHPGIPKFYSFDPSLLHTRWVVLLLICIMLKTECSQGPWGVIHL